MYQKPICNSQMLNQYQFPQNMLVNRNLNIVQQPFAPQYIQMQQMPRISQFQHEMCQIDKKIVKFAFKKKSMLKKLLSWVTLMKQEKELEKKKLYFKIYYKMCKKNLNKQNSNKLQKDNSNENNQDIKDNQVQQESQVIQNQSSLENKQLAIEKEVNKISNQTQSSYIKAVKHLKVEESNFIHQKKISQEINQQTSNNSQQINKQSSNNSEERSKQPSNTSQKINKQSSNTSQEINKSSSNIFEEINKQHQNNSQQIDQQIQTIKQTNVTTNQANKFNNHKQSKNKSIDTSFEETPKFCQKMISYSPQNISEDKQDILKKSSSSKKQFLYQNDSKKQKKYRNNLKVSEFDDGVDQFLNKENRDKNRYSNKLKGSKYSYKTLEKSKKLEKNHKKLFYNSQKDLKLTADKDSQQTQQLNLNNQKSLLYKQQVKIEETCFDEEFEDSSNFEFEENTYQYQQNTQKNNLVNNNKDAHNLDKKNYLEEKPQENLKIKENLQPNLEQNQKAIDEQNNDMNFLTPIKSICEDKSSRECSQNKENSRDKQSIYNSEIKAQNQNCQFLTSLNESALESTQPSQNEQFHSSLASQSNDQTQIISHQNTKIEQLEEQLIQFISEGYKDLNSVLEKAYQLREQLGMTKKDLTISEKWYNQFLQKYNIEFED